MAFKGFIGGVLVGKITSIMMVMLLMFFCYGRAEEMDVTLWDANLASNHMRLHTIIEGK